MSNRHYAEISDNRITGIEIPNYIQRYTQSHKLQ